MKKVFKTMAFTLLGLVLSVNLAWAADITLLPAGGNTKDGITITCSATYESDYRVYKNANLTITSAVGNITNIALTYTKAAEDGGGWASSYQPNAQSWTSPTANGEQARITKIVVTIASAKIDVTLSRNGVEQELKQQDSPFTLPTDEDPACEGWEFKGWSTSTVTSTTTAPTFVTQATATGTYYAVYGKTETSGGGSATESVTWSSRYNATTNVEGKELTIGTNAKVTHNKGSNDCQYYTTGTGIRVYSGGNFVVTASGSDMTAISLTFGSGDGSNTITANEGNYSNGSWSGTATSVTFSVGGTSGHRRIAGISVTYSGGTTTYNSNPSCATLYDVTVNASNGSIALYSDQQCSQVIPLTNNKASVEEGTTIWIKAIANNGYELSSWGGALSGTTNPTSLTINDHKTITATFVPATYQITYDLDGGEWNGEAGVATYTYRIGATLPTEDDVIKANNTFLGWFLNNEGDVQTTEIGTTETGDKSFTARWLASGAKNVTISGDDKLTYTTFKPTTVDKDAGNLTIDYSIEKGYTISAVAVTVNDAALTESEVVFNDEQLIITPTAGFTGNVSITFTVVEKMFTVTWMANKTQFKQEQIQEGYKVTLPAETPSDVISGEDTYKFQGWITASQYSSETVAPSYIASNTIEPTGDVTYYAVYAILTPGSISNDYVKITAKTDLVVDGQYIIASGTKALNSDVFSKYYLTATGVTISNNKITTTNAKLVWTIDDNDEGDVLFKSNDNGNYLQIIDAGSGHYNLVANSDEDGDHAYFTPSVSSGNWTLKSYTYKSYYVSYNSSYNEFTTSTSSSNLQLYKRQNNPDTYKNYRTRVAIIDHIVVNGTPVETKFVAGETFDATGLSIDVHYQGEDNPTNVTEGFTFAPTGALTTENNKITFTYQGKTADVDINVSNTVSGIAVTTDPSKMEYTEGEQFNPEGMVVTATYDNEAERVVTGYTYEPTGDLALGDKITVSFGGKTTDLAITIKPATKTTVNWFVEGVKLTEGEQSTAVIPGKKVTVLPTEPEACQGNQFMGWTKQETYYNATTAPDDLFKTLADAPVVGESETNYYAVFASEAVGTYDEKVTLTSLTAPTADKFTYAFAKSSGSTSPSWNANQAKTYVKNTLTVTSKNSRVITKIEYTYNINKNDKGNAPTGATVTGNNSDNGSWDATNKTWTSSTNAATTVTLTVNGSAGNYGFTAIKVYLTGGTVLSDYSTTCLAALAAPTITTAEGEYCGSVDVEITQPAGNPDGAKIMYSTDNETWTEYTAAVKLEASGTIYAKVVKDPKQTDVVSATYTVYPAYTLAQAATAASATSQIACLTFTDLLVQARTLSEAFLKASDGQIVLLNKSSHGLSVGDKLNASDAHLNFIKSHDLLQLTSMDGIEKNGTGTPVADVKSITEITSANYGQLVKIMNVTYDATNKKFTDASSKEIAVDAKFFVGGSLPSWPDGGKFNATGVVVLDNNSNAVIAPRNTDDLESLATPLDKPTNFAVASVNSYRASYSWTAVDNNVGYTLYIYDGETEIYKSTTIGKTRTDYAPTKDLEAGHTYTAKLVALGDKAEYSDSQAAEVTFTTNPNAQLNWYVGDNEEPYATTYASQEKVVTPEIDPTSPCATNYENFVTWYTEEIVSETGQITALDAAKKVKAGDAAASATTEQVYNFYAVFGKVQKAGTDKYVKVTESQDNWKGEYLIGYDEGDDKDALTIFDGSLTTLDAANNNKTVSFESDGSIAANETNNSYRFNIEKSTTEGYYTIQSASGIYIANTTNGNKLSESSTTAYKNTISWSERIDIATGENATASHLSFNSDQNQMRFRYYTSNKNNIILYKREKTNPQYSGYITTCPQTYTITIANNAKGVVVAAKTTEILKGASVKLTATANAGYTKTGGAWVVKKTATSEVVEGLVGGTNYLTMPDYDVTVDYNFQEKKDQFVDNLHGNTTIEKGGANYELPVLADFSETTGKPSDAFTKFIGWSATSYDSGEPATEKPAILEGNKTATGATYFAVWYNGSGKYITEYCQTAVPTNLHLVEEYHKATSVRIDWNNVDGADKYHIIVMDDETNIIADADVTESVYDLSGLTPGATYICTVKAHKDCWSDETEEFEFTTKENIQSYAVTINAEGGTYTIDPTLEDGKIQEGEIVTITNIAPTDAAHYFFKELTVPEATDLTEITGGYKFTMPGKAVTINIVFAEYPTVTWKMEGAADQTSIAVRNDDKFEVGTVKNAPANWKYKTYFPEFAGWVTADKCDAEGNVTTAEFITATTEVPATGLTVYGAVAKSSAPDCSTATKITSNENLDMSALYVIGIEFSETTLYYKGIDGTWGKMTSDVAQDAPMAISISGTASALALIQSDGKYIEPCTSNSFAVSDEQKLVVMNENGDLTYNSTRLLTYNHNSGSGGIRWYASTSSNPKAYLYKVDLAYEKLTINPQPDYGRTDLVVGNYGTVCVPYAVKTTDRSGATFWNIETSNAPGYTNPTSITIAQEEGDLVAGKPYIFCATETEMAMFFSGAAYDGGEDYPSNNGLYGNLTDETITINPTEYVPGYFFVLQQKLYECGVNCTVGPNRGWVQADQIGSEPVEAPVSAPRRVIGNPNGTPTGIHNLNADGLMNIQGARKYFHNNNIVIVNEGRIYNAQGILIQ